MKLFRIVILALVICAVAGVIGPWIRTIPDNEPGDPEREAIAAEFHSLTRSEARNLFAQALAAYYFGNYRSAESTIPRLTGNLPPDIQSDLLFWQAELSFRSGRLKEAKRYLSEYLLTVSPGPRLELARRRLALIEELGG